MKRKTVRYTDDKARSSASSGNQRRFTVARRTGAGQRFPGIFQAGSAAAQHQLSADDPQSGTLICACLRFGEANVIALPTLRAFWICQWRSCAASVAALRCLRFSQN